MEIKKIESTKTKKGNMYPTTSDLDEKGKELITLTFGSRFQKTIKLINLVVLLDEAGIVDYILDLERDEGAII